MGTMSRAQQRAALQLDGAAAASVQSNNGGGGLLSMFTGGGTGEGSQGLGLGTLMGLMSGTGEGNMDGGKVWEMAKGLAKQKDAQKTVLSLIANNCIGKNLDQNKLHDLYNRILQPFTNPARVIPVNNAIRTCLVSLLVAACGVCSIFVNVPVDGESHGQGMAQLGVAILLYIWHRTQYDKRGHFIIPGYDLQHNPTARWLLTVHFSALCWVLSAGSVTVFLLLLLGWWLVSERPCWNKCPGRVVHDYSSSLMIGALMYSFSIQLGSEYGASEPLCAVLTLVTSALVYNHLSAVPARHGEEGNGGVPVSYMNLKFRPVDTHTFNVCSIGVIQLIVTLTVALFTGQSLPINTQLLLAGVPGSLSTLLAGYGWFIASRSKMVLSLVVHSTVLSLWMLTPVLIPFQQWFQTCLWVVTYTWISCIPFLLLYIVPWTKRYHEEYKKCELPVAAAAPTTATVELATLDDDLSEEAMLPPPPPEVEDITEAASGTLRLRIVGWVKACLLWVINL